MQGKTAAKANVHSQEDSDNQEQQTPLPAEGHLRQARATSSLKAELMPSQLCNNLHLPRLLNTVLEVWSLQWESDRRKEEGKDGKEVKFLFMANLKI